MHINEIIGGYRVKIENNIDNTCTIRVTDIKLNHIYTVVGYLTSKQVKMLGRECRVVDFIRDRHGFICKAKVRYVDNNRIGQLSFENLLSKDSVIKHRQ